MTRAITSISTPYAFSSSRISAETASDYRKPKSWRGTVTPD